METISYFGCGKLTHLSYSPDQSPLGFHLLDLLENCLQGIKFSNNEEVKSTVSKWLKNSQKLSMLKEYKSCFFSLENSLLKHGDYILKYSIFFLLKCESLYSKLLWMNWTSLTPWWIISFAIFFFLTWGNIWQFRMFLPCFWGWPTKLDRVFAKLTWYSLYAPWGCPRGVMVKAMDCGIVVREFVLQSRYYVHFRTNTLEPPYPPSYGLNSTVLLGEWLWH